MEHLYCKHCGTAFKVLEGQPGNPSHVRHTATCEQKNEFEREFYLAHRRWPTATELKNHLRNS